MQQPLERIFIIDNDPSVCLGLSRLLDASGYQVETFHSAADFLARENDTGMACIILDINMPQKSGLELQLDLNARHIGLPIIFLTGHGDLPMGVQAMKRGAEDFLTKPVDEIILLKAVKRALENYRTTRHRRLQLTESQARVEKLTPRELEVLRYILKGEINKQIAVSLCISEKTVKAHRAKIMEKMAASSAVELGKLCATLDLEHTTRSRAE